MRRLSGFAPHSQAREPAVAMPFHTSQTEAIVPLQNGRAKDRPSSNEIFSVLEMEIEAPAAFFSPPTEEGHVAMLRPQYGEEEIVKRMKCNTKNPEKE